AALAEGYATATDLADYLVRKGMAFRDAHEVVARAVREAEARGVDLAELPVAELGGFSPPIGADAPAALPPEGAGPAPPHRGGAAPPRGRHGAGSGARRHRARPQAALSRA